MHFSRIPLATALIAAVCATLPASAEDSSMQRGEKIFGEKCALCHQATGQGVPTVYPPLAGSDFLVSDRSRAVKIVCEGLAGAITVNGKPFANIMPAQVLDDGQVADVLTYAGNSWGNHLAPLTAAEVEKTRKDTKYPTYADLLKATAFQPLPAAPAGWTLREVTQLPDFCTRLAGNGKGKVYVLGQNGTIYYLDQQAGAVAPIIKAESYLEPRQGDLVALGMTQDAEGRLWFVTNQRVTMEGEKFYQNEVIIYRTSQVIDGQPAAPKIWFKTHYHYGVGPYNHGVSTMGFGPDGYLYVNSGSRTDGGEAGTDSHFYPGGEVEITAGIWRLDPKAAEPKVEMFVHGIRNAFGFGWDGQGHFFSATNGPDFSSPEELDFVEQGKHYGFPYQFSDYPVKPHFPYAYTPEPPPGLEFIPAVENYGPAAGGSKDHPIASFDAHSSPGGMIWCGEDFPAPFAGSFLISRFGNLLGPPACPEDVGFDVLCCRLEKVDGKWQAHMTTALAPLGRPIDLLHNGGAKVLVLEYTRPTNFHEGAGWLPGRILELAPAK